MAADLQERAAGARAVASRPRPGFALLGVIVMVAIGAVLATVVTVTLGAGHDAGRIESVAEGLRRLGYEIRGELAPTFRSDVGRYPSRLSQLATKIVSGDLNSCGGTFMNPQLSGWKGPYHLTPMGANVATTGYTLATGFVANDLLVRDPATGNQNSEALLYIVMPGVSRADAEALGVVMDGRRTGSGPGTTVYFGTGDPVTVRYAMEIIGC